MLCRLSPFEQWKRNCRLGIPNACILLCSMDDGSCSTNIIDRLNNIGLCYEDIQWRRKMWKYVQTILNWHNIRSNVMLECRFLGSMIEGTGLRNLGSDSDIMICNKQCRVIHRKSDWVFNPHVITLLVDVAGVPPGYCILKAMAINIPSFVNSFKDDDNIPFNDSSSIIPNHQYLRCDHVFCQLNGPAIGFELEGVSYGMDLVHCFYTSWPLDTKEWIERCRPSDFPPRNFIHSAKEKPAHIVSVGHKASIYQAIEWRFSFASLELEIIQMWPTEAVQCYFVLKLVKDYINTRLNISPHVLSSYHMKTLMLWLVEETGIEYWQQHCLMECVKFSLRRLFTWVICSCIPHYVLRENNLFPIEINRAKHEALAAILFNLVSSSQHIMWAFRSALDAKQGIIPESAVLTWERIGTCYGILVYTYNVLIGIVGRLASIQNISELVEQFNDIIDEVNMISAEMVATEMPFFSREIEALPPALQYQMLKPTGRPRNSQEALALEYRKDVINIDPDVLLYYLQYLCFSQCGKSEQAQIAIDSLETNVDKRIDLHKGSALNVLGHCHMAQGNTHTAAQYFIKAIGSQRLCRASLIPLAVALEKLVRESDPK
ncbi:hypothetical protein ScPMuIL_018488 [Solemya velum]